MGINKNNKKKEEYIFDKEDFDKYLEYCKNSEYFYPRFPVREEYQEDKISLFLFKVLKIICLIYESWFTIFLLYLMLVEEYSFSSAFIFMFLPICLLLFTHFKTLEKLRKENNYNKNKIIEINVKYNEKCFVWEEKLKKKYISEKKKEFKHVQKLIKEQIKNNKNSKGQYWIPSWIYFIIEKEHNIVKYVGQTIYPARREKEHNREKYPEDKFIFEWIERKDLSEIDARERFWISRFGKENLNNVSSGGSCITKRKGYILPKPILYEDQTQTELEKIKKWLEVTEKKNNK